MKAFLECNPTSFSLVKRVIPAASKRQPGGVCRCARHLLVT